MTNLTFKIVFCSSCKKKSRISLKPGKFRCPYCSKLLLYVKNTNDIHFVGVEKTENLQKISPKNQKENRHYTGSSLSRKGSQTVCEDRSHSTLNKLIESFVWAILNIAVSLTLWVVCALILGGLVLKIQHEEIAIILGGVCFFGTFALQEKIMIQLPTTISYSQYSTYFEFGVGFVSLCLGPAIGAFLAYGIFN